MEEMDNKLTINIENGEKAVINVLDIIDSCAFNKSFIIYSVDGKGDTIYASILNESDTTYSLDTITEQAEIDYINAEINRVINQLEAA